MIIAGKDGRGGEMIKEEGMDEIPRDGRGGG